MFWEAMWAPSTNSKIPVDKMKSIGEDPNGFQIYVGRATVEGDLIPGKFILEKKKCYVSRGGKEYGLRDYELLLDDKYAWVESSNGAIHNNAVVGGITSEQETLFIGRAMHEGHLVPGKIQPSHECLYVPFCGAEHAYTTYEILVKEENNEISVPIPLEEEDKTENGLIFPSDDDKRHQPWRKSADKLIECQLCIDRMIEIIFIPCGHGACSRCGHGYEKCFKCREEIQRIQKICFE